MSGLHWKRDYSQLAEECWQLADRIEATPYNSAATKTFCWFHVPEQFQLMNSSTQTQIVRLVTALVAASEALRS